LSRRAGVVSDDTGLLALSVEFLSYEGTFIASDDTAIGEYAKAGLAEPEAARQRESGF
jgi:hypothetical protein